MKIRKNSERRFASGLRPLSLAIAGLSLALTARSADIFWQGGTADYTNAASWVGGVVPGTSDNAINASGSNNIVQISVGNPDWTVVDLSAGGLTDSSGAYVQNGQTVTSTGWFHVANGTNAIGYYTLNGGTINVNGGRIFLCEAPNTTGFLNINGGTINKSGDVFVLADGGWNGSGARTGTVNQVNGTVNSSSELWLGQVPLGNGVYNLSGGALNLHNWLAVGRAGGTGTFNMTGGTFTKDQNGNFLVGTGNGSVGTLNQSGGDIICANQFQCPESGNNSTLGTYNLSGTGTLTVNDWIAIGRSGAAGVLNMNGGTITKNGNIGNHITIGSGGVGTVNQTNGTITSTASDTFIGETSSATWNMYGGTNIFAAVHLAQTAGGAQCFLNLNGGLFRATELAGVNAGSLTTVNFNGSILQAGADNPTFLHDLTLATIGSGGLTIDSQGFNIGASQALTDNGSSGLIKKGAGTLTLTGANNYGGPNTVLGGKLITGTSSSASGDYTIADGAGMGVIVQSANGQYNVGNVTLGTSAGGTLDFDVDGFGNPSGAPLNVLGAFAVRGTITVNIADALPQVGQFPLVHFSTLTGPANFVLGTLPTGVSANLVTNVANSSIDLNISVVNLPRWEGQAGGNWDIGLTTNWINLGTGLATFYSDGNQVLFDDNATGTTNVNITTTVKPLSVTVNNSNLLYNFVGSGRISGATSLVKQGTNVLSILNTGGNNYTGSTIISNGILVITNLADGGSPSPIGASSASPTNLVVRTTLEYAGAPVTANRGFTIASANTVIDAEGNFNLGGQVVASAGSALHKIGSATFGLKTVGNNEFSAGPNPGLSVVAGTMLLDGSAGAQTNHTQNEMWVGGTPDSGASLVLSNTTLNVDSWLGLGRGNGTTGNASSLTLFNSTANFGNVSLGYDNGISGNLASQTITVTGASTFVDHGDMNLAESTGSSATINIGGTSTFSSQNRVLLAMNTTTASMTIANSAKMIVNNGWFSVGAGPAAVASLVVKDSATLSISVDLNVTDVGVGMTGTALAQDNAQINANNLWVGKDNGVTAIFTITNNATVISSNGITLATFFDGTPRVPSNAVVNLGGGSLAVNLVQGSVTTGTNNGIFNFNGGRLLARKPIGANFMFNLQAINVQSGGAVIDSDTNSIAIAQPLLDAGGGGLTKLGNGTLRLNGANTYIGTTLVSAGALGGSGTILGPVNVASGAKLAPGGSAMGTLSVDNSLTFSSGSSVFFRISNDGGTMNNDLVSGLTGVTYGGTLVVTNVGTGSLAAGNVFKLFNSAAPGAGNFTSVVVLPAGSGTFDPASGQLTITSGGATTVTLNKPIVSGGNLILTGTGNANTPYTLLSTTNVALPLSQWITNVSSAFDNTGNASNAIPLSTTNRFFLLRQP
jgi:autotransporter-associated beta strand protein